MYFNQLKNAIFSELKSRDAITAKTYLQMRERYNYYVSKLTKFEQQSNEDYFNEIEYIKDTLLPSATANYILAKKELDNLVFDIMEDIIINKQSADWLANSNKYFKNESLTIENINLVNKLNFELLYKKLMIFVDNSENSNLRIRKGLADLYFIMLNVIAKNGEYAIEKISRLENKSNEVFSENSFLIELYLDFNYYSKGNEVFEKFLVEITDKNSSFNNLTDDDLIRFADSSKILSAKIDLTEDEKLNLKPEYIIKKCRKSYEKKK